MLRNKLIFTLVGLGILAGFSSAYVYAVPKKAMPPAFDPAANPYGKGIYANGIVESFQASGENMNLYPEVSGTLVRIDAAEGQTVTKGTPLAYLDDSVQRALVEQQRSQADAALSVLDALRAQPRKETLDVARAQVELARATLKSAEDQLAKQARSYELAPESVSKDAYDNALNAEKVARANLEVVGRQFELTQAGAWAFDVKSQERQHEALVKAALGSEALLAKYVLRAPADGVVLSVHASVGGYVSPQGAYDAYTEGFGPVIVMGAPTQRLGVRAYIDEILIPRLPPADKMRAQMFVRGTNVRVPLEFVRVQPHVSPKIQLSNQRTEKVDLRVLPVIFRFEPPKDVAMYPGQLVDVYVGDASVAP